MVPLRCSARKREGEREGGREREREREREIQRRKRNRRGRHVSRLSVFTEIPCTLHPITFVTDYSLKVSSSKMKREREKEKGVERTQPDKLHRTNRQCSQMDPEGCHRLKRMKTCLSSEIFILRNFSVTRLRVVYTTIPLLRWIGLHEHVDRPFTMFFSVNTRLQSRLWNTVPCSDCLFPYYFSFRPLP